MLDNNLVTRNKGFLISVLCSENSFPVNVVVVVVVGFKGYCWYYSVRVNFSFSAVLSNSQPTSWS